jgi:hypothetical protein
MPLLVERARQGCLQRLCSAHSIEQLLASMIHRVRICTDIPEAMSEHLQSGIERESLTRAAQS